MKFEIMEITPEVAASMLKKNTRNRNLRNQYVDSLASDMRNGNWEITPAAISFTSDGYLLDGQHRLAAVVKSGVTIKSAVCYDAPQTMAVDNGLKRTIADQFKMGGSALKGDYSSNIIIATIRFTLQLKSNTFQHSAHQVQAFIIENVNAVDDLIECTQKEKTAGITNAPVLSAMLYHLINGMDKEVVKKFYSVLVSGYQTSADDKMLIIHRNWLMNNIKKNNFSNKKMKFSRTCEVLRLMSIGQPKLKLFLNNVRQTKTA